MTTATVYKLPDMYRMDSKGKTRIRKSIVRALPDGSAIWTIETGIKDGALVKKDTVYKEGKQGRNAFEQACFEANSKHESKQKKEKYQENIKDIAAGGDFELMVPMTAEDVAKVNAKHVPRPPFFMQPKLDGNRCMIRITRDGKLTKWSRQGNVFNNLDHLDHKLLEIGRLYYEDEKSEDYELPELIMDGELFTFEMPFKDINGITKSEKKDIEELSGRKLEKALDQLERREKIQFWWFDIVNEEPFAIRSKMMLDIAVQMDLPEGDPDSTARNSTIVRTQTAYLQSQEDADTYHKNCVSMGYEGSMIRTDDSLYEHKRSKTLLKRKDFFDEEYKIIRIERMDRYPNQGIYICETHKGKEFGVTPKCSHEEREEILKNAKKYLGKMLTVAYFEKFEDGTPRFGQGLRVREER